MALVAQSLPLPLLVTASRIAYEISPVALLNQWSATSAGTILQKRKGIERLFESAQTSWCGLSLQDEINVGSSCHFGIKLFALTDC